jgi:hypothetical protein
MCVPTLTRAGDGGGARCRAPARRFPVAPPPSFGGEGEGTSEGVCYIPPTPLAAPEIQFHSGVLRRMK